MPPRSLMKVQMAINQISGKVSNLINDLRNDMVQIISNINVNIDYPEYDDVEIMTNNLLIPKIQGLKQRIEKILKESENGKITFDKFNLFTFSFNLSNSIPSPTK